MCVCVSGEFSFPGSMRPEVDPSRGDNSDIFPEILTESFKAVLTSNKCLCQEFTWFFKDIGSTFGLWIV